MSKNFRTKFEEIHFSMIFGIAKDEDFNSVLNPKRENIKYKPYFRKVSTTLLTHKDYILQKNPNINDDLKNQINQKAQNFLSPNLHEQKLIKFSEMSYQSFLDTFDNELFKKESFKEQTFIEDLQNKILYEQSQYGKNKETIPLKLIFYILMIRFAKEKKADSLKVELKTFFDKVTNNKSEILEKLLNFSHKMNNDFVNLDYIFEQMPAEENTHNELTLFSTKILYYFIKEPNNFIEIFITIITTDDYYLDEKYYPGLNLMLNFAFVCNADELTFILNINNIFFQSNWYMDSHSNMRNIPSNIEISLFNTIYSHLKEKHYLCNYALRNSAYIGKIMFNNPILIELTKENEKPSIIFDGLSNSLLKLIHLQPKTPLLSYQIYFFVLFCKNYILTRNIQKLKKIKISPNNKTNEIIDIHFLFVFLHPTLRSSLISRKDQENNALTQAVISLENNENIINPFEIINYEDFEGKDSLQKEEAFFQNYLHLPNVISLIPNLDSQDDNYIQLYWQHFKDNIKKFNAIPFIIYHSFCLKTKRLSKELLMNIKEIKIEDNLYYEFIGIISSKEIYVYHKVKELFYYVNKDMMVNLSEYKIPSNQEIFLVYYKLQSKDEFFLSINKPLVCKEDQTIKKFNQEQQKILFDSCLWIVKGYFNYILKNETFFIEFFNLVDPIKIEELYKIYEQQPNSDLQKFCCSLVNKYMKKEKQLNEIFTNIHNHLQLWRLDEFNLNFNNYLFGDVPDKTMTEKKIVQFIDYYFEHFEDIPSDNDCKVVTLLTSLILIKQNPNNEFLLKISIGNIEKMNKNFPKIIKLIKSNIDDSQIKYKVMNYWNNYTSSKKEEKELGELDCDLMFLMTQKNNLLTTEQFKSFFEKNKHLYKKKYENQYEILCNYFRENLYESHNLLYRDLICIFFQSSPLFISKGNQKPTIVEWKLFEHYINEVICIKDNILKSDVSSVTKEEQINITLNILTKYKPNNKDDQLRLISYFGLLKKGEMLLWKSIRNRLIDYTLNTHDYDLQFLIIFFYDCCKIKKKELNIANSVKTIIQNNKVSDWNWNDVHYLFMFFHKNIKNSGIPTREEIEQTLNELYKKNKNLKINCFESNSTPTPLFPLIEEENACLNEKLKRSTPLFSIITSTQTEQKLGDIIYYILPTQVKNLYKEIFMYKKYKIKGLLFINKKKLKDIWLYNKHNQYFFSISKKTWNHTYNKEVFSAIVGVYNSSDNVYQYQKELSYNDIHKDSQFCIIQKHYLNEIIWIIKNNINTLQEQFKLFDKAFDFKNNISKIKELKDYSSLSSDEKTLFDKLINP